MSYHLIVNPAAGRGRALKLLPEAQRYFAERELELNVYQTEAPGHATEIVRGLAEGTRVLSLGGDGTLHEVMLACLGSERTVGILPGGSGDDFAHALGIRRMPLSSALSAVTEGRVRRVDTGTVNGQPFVNALGIGFDAEVAHNFYHAPGVLRAKAAYLYAVFYTLRQLQNPEVEIEVDGEPAYAGPALLVAMMNGPRVGGSFYFSPQARVNDGLLDILIAKGMGRFGVLPLLSQVMRGKHLNHPKVVSLRGRHIKLRWRKPRYSHVEGELLEASCDFEVKVQPASLKVFAP